jgi:ComF family protein
VRQLRWLDGPSCRGCGVPLEHATRRAGLPPTENAAEPARCRSCRLAPLAIAGIVAAAEYCDPLGAALRSFKYRYRRELARALVDVLLQGVGHRLPPHDILVPVPLFASRQRERGFNHAAVLARGLAQALGCRYDGTLLERVRPTAQQARLSRQQRRANLAGAFAAAPHRATGQRVVVVDDICTTGSTLEACALALTAAGAREVWGCAVARTVERT